VTGKERMKITLHRAVVYTMKPALVTSIKQYLVLCDLNFYFPFLCTSLNLIKLVLSIHLSYMTLFQCSLGRSGQKKIMCVYCHMLKKSRVGRSGLLFFFLLLLLSTKTGNSGSRFRNPNPVFLFQNFR
jgi:hypothetical protein